MLGLTRPGAGVVKHDEQATFSARAGRAAAMGSSAQRQEEREGQERT